MASFNFGLLELADGESGEAAVSVVVGKAKAEAAQAKKAAEVDAAESAAATGAEREKAALKNLYFHKLQHDNGIRSIEYELKRLREVLIKLRGDETNLKKKGENGAYLIPFSEEQRELRLTQLLEDQRNMRQQQLKLRQQEAKLRPLRKEFYLEHGFALGSVDEEPPVPIQDESVQGNDNAGVDNGNGGYYSDGYGSARSYHDGEPHVHADEAYYVYHERQGEEGYAYSNNGGRQGYPDKRKGQNQKWVEVNRPSSDAGTDADHKPEEKVSSDVGSEAEHKSAEETTTKANADAKPSSGSEKSSSAGADSSKKQQDGSKPPEKNKLSGSQKRKMRNAAKKNGGSEVDKAKKQDSSEGDVSKKTDKEPLADYPREEEKKTLAEYEKILQEKKKSSEDVSRTEQRKVSAEEFKGLQMLEKKKLDDEETVVKAEKVENKAKDAGKEEKVQPDSKNADNAKTKKVVKFALKDLSFAPPKRVVIFEDGSTNAPRGRFNGGGYQGREDGSFNGPRGRFNGGSYQGRSRDNSTDAPPVSAAGRGGDNGQNEAGNYGNGASRGGYSGGRGFGPRGDYSGGRGDGPPRGDYSGGRVNGYSGRGNGGYQGNGGYHNQGGNDGGYQQQQQGGYQRRNDNYYRPRGRGYSGNGRSSPKPIPVEDENVFPPLPASAPARGASSAAAPAAAPAQS